MMEQKSTVPKLRFPGFEGEWEEKKLDDEISFLAGYAFDSISMSNEPSKYQLLKMSNVYQNELRIDRNPSYWPSIQEKQKRFLLKNGDVILTLTGTVGKKDYGYSVSIEKDNSYLLNQRLVRLREKETKSSNDFIKYLVTGERFLYNFFGVSKGGTGNQSNVSIEDIKNILLSFPTLPEQQKIASFLTSVDGKLQALKKKKSLLEQYKKGVMQKIFSQELRFNAKNGEDFPDWEEKALCSRVDVKSSKYNPEKDKTSYKCIELEHISSEAGQILGYTDSLNSGSIKNMFNKGDVLFGKLRPYLRKYLKAPFSGVCSSEIWVLRGLEKLSNEFLYYLVQTDFFIELANQSTGSKMPRADWNVVSQGKFDFPSPLEQTKIANFLSAIDEKINLCGKEIEKTAEWKKGLLQGMFC